MRYVLMSTIGLAALAVSGCSKSETSNPSGPMRSEMKPADSAADRTASPPMADMAVPPTNGDSAGSGAPGVNVTAAPGVAFNYNYAFRMPADKIANAQEAHAQACEKLGVTQCRITGMRYRVNGENSIQGILEFKLDPALARKFGKDGIDAVVAAKGKLIEAEITGDDAGAAIDRLKTQKTNADAEIARIDKELARPGLKAEERAELQSQRAALLGQINNVKTDTKAQEESLATTPMTFQYESGPAVVGFDESAPITSAGNIFVGSVTVTLGIVLTLLAALAPPGVILLLAFLLWRQFRPRKKPVTDAA